MARLLGDPYGTVGRRLMYANGVAIVVVCGIAALHVGHWRWWLFAWGIGAGLLSATVYGLLLKLLPALLHLPAERTAQAQPRLAQMKHALYPVLLSLGLGIGLLSSGLANAWPDILLTVGIPVFQLMPMALFPALRQRVPTSGNR